MAEYGGRATCTVADVVFVSIDFRLGQFKIVIYLSLKKILGPPEFFYANEIKFWFII